LILSPDGKVLVKTQGYQDFSQGGDQDFRKYLGNLSRIDAQYAAQGKRLPRTNVAAADKPKSEKPPVVANNGPPAKTTPGATPSATADKLVPPPTEPKKIAAAQPSPPALPLKGDSHPELPVAAAIDSSGMAGGLLAMEGYCPVTLRMTRAWKTGSSEITLEHEGQTFYFTAPEKRDEFKANPGKFAPRLRGCDSVALVKNDLAVRGSVKFGAFYEGELFLFETADNRAAFRKDPVKFARLQHALKPEDVKKIASAVGQ
jgi:YHS domain-containing protein